MKIVTSLLMLASAVHAFVPKLPHRSSFVTLPRMAGAVVTETSDFATAMPEAMSSPYERLGVPEDKLALGIDANEVLQWLGTREDLVETFLRDNKSFTRERAEMEVDKFLMDGEMITVYINYKKNDGSVSLREEEPKTNPLTSLLSLYAAWVVGGFALSYIRKTFINPKLESGEWEPIDIGGFFGKGADTAADSISSAVQTAAPSVSSVIDTISDAATSAM